MRRTNDDMRHTSFPKITYRRGAFGRPVPVVRGTGIRVETIVTASDTWSWKPKRIADEYELALNQVKEALSFYEAHREEIDNLREIEASIAWIELI